MFLSLTLCALLTEGLIGYPDAVFRRIGHPVTWIGRLITALDHWLNPAISPTQRAGEIGSVAPAEENRGLRCRNPSPESAVWQTRALGLVALLLIVGLPVGVTLVAQAIAARFLPASLVFVFEAIFASTLIAQRSLYSHVRAVLIGLRSEGLAGGRRAVAMIVGRDPETLDRAGVVRAAIESLAENFSDGVVAPVFWMAVFGLPGAVAYKAINTADSMIGHLTPKHTEFGRASALCDDCVNSPASRLAALWLVLASASLGNGMVRAIRAVWRDAARHRSPNAGWPEAAMAGGLALRLAGPRQYKGVLVADSWMGDGRSEAEPGDLSRALRLYCLACAFQGAFLLALLVWI
ncbi:adenosylcobinamide-phosphate synthase CbiB [Asaia lannensis]|uniref:adenosylcobinamide-phosphate synthase CbiB n=1 Tax=Asaia lannensis TaxID=415421 RepID=UPI001C990592